ncbi:MAG: 50S ribosomal protein L35 [Actinomycetota bacterium]
MKSNRAAKKRFKVTSTGKILHKKAWGSHLFKSKTKPRQIRLKGEKVLADVEVRRVRKMI